MPDRVHLCRVRRVVFVTPITIAALLISRRALVERARPRTSGWPRQRLKYNEPQSGFVPAQALQTRRFRLRLRICCPLHHHNHAGVVA